MNARTFERRQIIEREPPVTCPARNNDRTSADVFVIGQTQQELIRVRVHAHDRLRYRHLDTEFLRLVVGAGHQGHAADPGGEAEVVFDAR